MKIVFILNSSVIWHYLSILLLLPPQLPAQPAAPQDPAAQAPDPQPPAHLAALLEEASFSFRLSWLFGAARDCVTGTPITQSGVPVPLFFSSSFWNDIRIVSTSLDSEIGSASRLLYQFHTNNLYNPMGNTA